MVSDWTPNSPTERLEAIAKIYRDADELSAELERDALLRPEFWAPRKGAS